MKHGSVEQTYQWARATSLLALRALDAQIERGVGGETAKCERRELYQELAKTTAAYRAYWKNIS